MMNETERKQKSTALRKILETMELPSFRIQHMGDANLAWLQRNIQVQNADHPDIDAAIALLKELRKNK